MQHRPGPARTLAALLALSVPAAAQDVRVLDKANGPYLTAADAFAAAADGDVILVAPGTYPNAPAVVGRSLTVVAPEGATFHHLSIRDLGPDDVVTLRGIVFRRNNTTSLGGAENVRIADHEGLVIFEDCAFRTQVLVAGSGPTFPAIDASAPAGSRGGVLLTRCTVDGGDGAQGLGGALPPMEPSEAIAATNQDVVLFDSTLTGGAAGPADDGADAVRLQDSALHVHGGTITGGAGGEGTSGSGCQDGGDGGSGVVGTGDVTWLAATILGGPGGAAGSVGCSAGVAGAAVSVAGTATDLGGVSTGVELAPAAVQTGDVATLDVLGPAPPGGAVWALHLGTTPALLPTGGGLVSGVAILPAPLQFGPPALLAGGATSLALPVQNAWAPGQEARVVHAQGFFLDPTVPAIYFGAPTTTAVLLPGLDPL